MAESGIKKTMNYVIGISSISLILIVLLIIFGNLSGNMGFKDATHTTYIVNQTGAWINATNPYTLSGYNSTWSSISVTSAVNGTNNTAISTGLYSVSTSGVLTNLTATAWNTNVWLNFNYVHTYKTDTEAESVITNYTSGVGKLTSQIPTILLFVGIGLLLFVLIGVLVWVIRKMSNIGSSQSSFRSKGNLE